MLCAFSVSQSWWTLNAAGLTNDMLQAFKSGCIPYLPLYISAAASVGALIKFNRAQCPQWDEKMAMATSGFIGHHRLHPGADRDGVAGELNTTRARGRKSTGSSA
jgi:hypothetical protein